MAPRQKKRLIEVFRNPTRGPAHGAESSKCTTCGAKSSCSDATESLDEWLERMTRKYGDTVKLRVVVPNTDKAISKTIDTLNGMLEAKHEDIRVNREDFETFMCEKGPIIAVDGLLFFMREVPTDDRIERALEIATKVNASMKPRSHKG